MISLTSYFACRCHLRCTTSFSHQQQQLFLTQFMPDSCLFMHTMVQMKVSIVVHQQHPPLKLFEIGAMFHLLMTPFGMQQTTTINQSAIRWVACACHVLILLFSVLNFWRSLGVFHVVCLCSCQHGHICSTSSLTNKSEPKRLKLIWKPIGY